MDERIVDNTPSNFLYVGLIHLALPNARIVHARREAVDTCLSCFSILFDGDQPFSYDLGELARYYRAYEALMDHWRSVLPKGAMLEVQFEQVVDDLEGQARRIIDYCGLEWEDGCLAGHENQRPLQASSVGRWHNYADMLQPLLRELYMGPLDYGVADSQR
jgi:Sulfotransferase family